jgi:hypothetical protein
MTEEQLAEYTKLVNCINNVFVENKATLHGAINALSYMSVDLAVRNNMDEKVYIKDIRIMIKEIKAKYEQRTDAS